MIVPQFDLHFLSPLLFWSVVSFGILLFLLHRYAFPLIFKILEERENKIRGSLEEADRIRQEAKELLAQYESKLKGVQQEVQSILEDARNQARRLIEEGQERMKREAQQMIKEAKADIERQRQQVMGEIQEATVDLILTTTEKILERELTQSDHRRLVEEVIQEVAEGRQSQTQDS